MQIYENNEYSDNKCLNQLLGGSIMNKATSIIIIVVCLMAAILLFNKFVLSSGSGGTDDISSDEMTWVKCRNCQAQYQMKLKEFYKELEANTDPKMAVVTPGIKCKECGQDKVYQAIKCPKCGDVFFLGSVRGKLDDTCPKCGYSEKEESRKNR